MSDIPAELVAAWAPMEGTPTPRRVMEFLVHCSVDGLFGYSIAKSAPIIGLERTTMQHEINHLRASGAIVIVKEGRGSYSPVYRIADPDRIRGARYPRWSPERIKIMNEMWYETDTPTVIAALNALRGDPITIRQAHEYASRKKLRRSKEWLTRFHGGTMRRIAAEKAAANAARPKEPKAPAPHRPRAPRAPAATAASLLTPITGRLGSSVTLRTPGLKAGPGPVWAPGVCQWPLECLEPAQGRFCADHGGMVRGRRTRDERMEAGE